MVISDFMNVPLQGKFNLSVLRKGKKYAVEFIDFAKNKKIIIEGSTAQISRARALEVIMLYQFRNNANLPEYAKIENYV